MPNAILTNLGANNLPTGTGTGGALTDEQLNELFMKKFSGEVFAAYTKKCLFKDFQRTRIITSGKSATFAYTGNMSARYHKRGTPILGSNNPPISEQTINVDDLLISDVAIDNLDELKLHFDVRKEYSKKIGESLALGFDQHCARIAVLAARSNALNKDHQGGTVLKNATAATNAQTLADMAYLAAQTFDEKDVPEDDRHFIVAPAQYYMLLTVKDLINRDYGGSGSYQKANLGEVASMALHKTNRLPNTNITAAVEGEKNTYFGDFTNTVALCLNREAIGSVQLRGLKVQKSGAEFETMYQANMMVASYSIGHGILRPECAIEISKAAA
ncbi:MAG: phage capsid protein [Cloacibacillus sp.]